LNVERVFFAVAWTEAAVVIVLERNADEARDRIGQLLGKRLIAFLRSRSAGYENKKRRVDYKPLTHAPLRDAVKRGHFLTL
jgi:hypothetical protein